MIADAMDKVGKDGVITVEEGEGARNKCRSSRVCNLIVVISLPFYHESRFNGG